MSRFPALTTLFVFLFLQPAVSAARKPSQLSLTEKLNSILSKNGVSRDQIGIYIADGSGTELVDINGKKAMIPASLTKIVTAAAALNQWDQSFTFKTQFYVDSEITNKVLPGSLYFKGGADPSLISERLWFLVNALTREDITSIEGDIVLDESRFDSIRFDEGRDPPVEGRAFDAPVSALSFNWNSVNVFVRPGANGEPPIVKIDPPNDYIVGINNKAKTVSGGEAAINVSRVPIKTGNEITGDRVMVSGKIPLKNKELVFYRSISEPDLWAGHNLVQFLKQRGIHVKGKVRRGVVPNSARLLVETNGASIGDMVQDMMKFSNNYVAEMLTKNLAAENGEKPATMNTGLEQVKKYLDELKIPRAQYTIVSPSGLSRRNTFSPYVLWKILQETRTNFAVFPEFMNSLPVAGIDGTLKNRMKDPPAKKWVRAKTGLLNGVAGLAGYAGKGKDVYGFAFIYNGSRSEPSVRDVLDKMAYAILD